jgi:hypothetical protein
MRGELFCLEVSHDENQPRMTIGLHLLENCVRRMSVGNDSNRAGVIDDGGKDSDSQLGS